MIKVIIADDIQILRQGLRAILVRDPEIQVAGLAANGREALELCAKHHPDVVLMDMRMPEYDGSWGIRQIKEQFPDIRILVLTTFDDDETVEAALSSGADGYILKEMDDEKVIQSVKAVCGGMRIFGEKVFEGMRRQMHAGQGVRAAYGAGAAHGAGAAPGTGAALQAAAAHSGKTVPGASGGISANPELAARITDRERDIMRCVARGMDNKEIAAELFLAEGTVRNNISRLLEKLKLKDRTQLAVFTVKNRLD